MIAERETNREGLKKEEEKRVHILYWVQVVI